jgi:PAS domain-containing protein
MGNKNNNDFERILLDNIPFLAWYKDNEGKYIMVNEAFARVYHLSPEDIIGKTDFDIC